jgi:hypothetical protein
VCIPRSWHQSTASPCQNTSSLAKCIPATDSPSLSTASAPRAQFRHAQQGFQVKSQYQVFHTDQTCMGRFHIDQTCRREFAPCTNSGPSSTGQLTNPSTCSCTASTQGLGFLTQPMLIVLKSSYFHTCLILPPIWVSASTISTSGKLFLSSAAAHSPETPAPTITTLTLVTI